MTSDEVFFRSNQLGEGIDISETKVYIDKEMIISSCPISDSNLDILKIYTLDPNYSYQFICSVSRISLYEPIYVDCEIVSERLSKAQLVKLINILNSKRQSIPFRYDDNEYPFTIWQMIIAETNRVYESSGNIKRIRLDLPIPDYSLLETKN